MKHWSPCTMDTVHNVILDLEQKILPFKCGTISRKSAFGIVCFYSRMIATDCLATAFFFIQLNEVENSIRFPLVYVIDSRPSHVKLQLLMNLFNWSLQYWYWLESYDMIPSDHFKHFRINCYDINKQRKHKQYQSEARHSSAEANNKINLCAMSLGFEIYWFAWPFEVIISLGWTYVA